MSDMYAVDFCLDLKDSVPIPVLTDLQWHLGVRADGAEYGESGAAGAYPLLAGRGPAARVGGVLVGELVRTPAGWSLTTRQEVHAESLPDLESLAERLARHSRTEGAVGTLRFYEDDLPVLLVNRSGLLVKVPLAVAEPAPVGEPG
ncbi:hypothetical protein OG599_11695 [Streptomyces sp. NBC_01335]|uniref:hypothetical protein n=1 Tax=Streptomyces sp. NBC_01335 TaxID=2903828 RepID=UPI002E0F2CB8|nr:hypothetical protein OG599_11695 [Streptomyces sp. NBC_01335]